MGSPIWQGGLFVAAIVFLIWETWRGWRMGLVRSGMQLAAIVVATLAGLAIAHGTALPFGGFREPAGFLAGLMAGTAFGLLTFVILWLLSALLFKRTDHQSSGIARLVWGAGGAAFGLALGILILWGGISVIRAIGSLAEVRVAATEAARPSAPAPPIAGSLVKLKESLELGPPGKFVQSVDPLPTDFYELITKAGQVGTSEAALLRFLEYPGMQDVLQHPKMVALLNDPTVQEAAQSGNVFRIMSNKHVFAAVQDPGLAAALKKINLREALDYASATPTPTP